MGKSVLFLLLCLSAITGCAQPAAYELPRQKVLSIQQERSSTVNYLNDFNARLWDNLQMDYYERMRLEQRRTGPAPQPANYVYPQDNYKQLLQVDSMVLTVSSNGALLSAKSNSDQLTTEQKNLLSRADLGSRIKVQLRFTYKNRTKDNYGPRDEAVEAEVSISLLPAQAAEFPGGEKQLSAFFGTRVVQQLSSEWDRRKLERGVVNFTVSETGAISNAVVVTTTGDKQIDALLLESIKDMPSWKPAVNSAGVKVKQVVVIPFGEGC